MVETKGVRSLIQTKVRKISLKQVMLKASYKHAAWSHVSLFILTQCLAKESAQVLVNSLKD